MSKHPFHRLIGKLLTNASLPGSTLILDAACGGDQHVPLFTTPVKSRATRLCDVDILVIKDDTIRVIIEIEESNVSPVQILGKVMASSFVQYHINSRDRPFSMHRSVLFIQILDSSSLNDGSHKPEQWQLIDSLIQQIVPVQGGSVDKYRLTWGTSADFENHQGVELLEWIQNA